MSRLHKITKFSLIKKYYLSFILLIIFGIYKNGVVPFINDYSTLTEMIFIFILPLLSFLIGCLFDYFWKNKDLFNSKFYSLLFTMIIPIETNFFLYFLCLSVFLFIYNYLSLKKNDSSFNLITYAKLFLVIILIVFKSYNYQNVIEESGIFQYSILDILLGYGIGGIYTTSVFLIILSLIILAIDNYYKKEISFYSYGIYLITLFIYAFIKQDMSLILVYMFSSSILFGLIFIATLSNYSPYTKKMKFFYSLVLGCSILPFSLLVNFQEGIYISIILANFLVILLNLLFQKNFKSSQYLKKLKRK